MSELQKTKESNVTVSQNDKNQMKAEIRLYESKDEQIVSVRYEELRKSRVLRDYVSPLSLFWGYASPKIETQVHRDTLEREWSFVTTTEAMTFIKELAEELKAKGYDISAQRTKVIVEELEL